jgi:hypothetical protein
MDGSAKWEMPVSFRIVVDPISQLGAARVEKLR